MPRPILYMAALEFARHNPVLKVLYQRLGIAEKAENSPSAPSCVTFLSSRRVINPNFSFAI